MIKLKVILPNIKYNIIPCEKRIQIYSRSFYNTPIRCFTKKNDLNVIEELKKRGLVNALTSFDVINQVKNQTTIYCGVDPTAPSLHLGNLLTLIGLLHFNLHGHRTIALIGGATGSIGDPSGRNTERLPLSFSTIEKNVIAIDNQIRQIFINGKKYASRRGFKIGDELDNVIILNNLNWFQKMSALELLNDIGRYARVGTMLARDSVKSRMENTGGISFTEFSYQLLQAYDFWHLYHYHQCRIQLGGSDQWGNITAGIDLIHKKKSDTKTITGSLEPIEHTTAFGVTMPLLLTSTGEKFGKSAGNAIWLDDKMTSAYELYQYFMKITDADLEKYLRMFTILSIEEIDQILKTHMESPEKRYGHEKLASEITEFVHGVAGLQRAQLATRVLFGDPLENIRGHDLIEAFSHDSQRLTSIHHNKIVNCTIDRVAVAAGACKSRSEANKLIKVGGLYLNDQRVINPQYKVMDNDLLDGIVCVIRTGKSNYHLIRVIE
ncbi:tyrosine-tRNA ligase [Glomus cerebriforme]|uniref:Tyrosine--tRNA ligase n=1 Tax=Glomus cerebriforme TaxID=658196 RepID=A0A397SIJ5_9GLOM|nr:tyrosine-tRNA ligase [Glomus cerebriforme]